MKGVVIKMKFLFSILSLLFIIPLITGCSTDHEYVEKTYNTIEPEEAKEMMTDDENVIILDVREKDEYDEGHIEGALLLSNNDITFKAEEVLPDKSATILVYCRSGNRSAQASQKLAELDYTNVYDFGGILDWPYELVTE